MENKPKKKTNRVKDAPSASSSLIHPPFSLSLSALPLLGASPASRARAPRHELERASDAGPAPELARATGTRPREALSVVVFVVFFFSRRIPKSLSLALLGLSSRESEGTSSSLRRKRTTSLDDTRPKERRVQPRETRIESEKLRAFDERSRRKSIGFLLFEKNAKSRGRVSLVVEVSSSTRTRGKRKTGPRILYYIRFSLSDARRKQNINRNI